MQRPAAIIDVGTGYTKLGFSGNLEPTIIPTLISQPGKDRASGAQGKDGLDDLDYYIGDEAMVPRHNFTLESPMRQGMIDNWDMMEKFWSRCIYQYLQCDPEEHFFMLTEPPMNTPENREYTAEIMFETFNVPALCISVQAVLALCGSLLATPELANKSPSITGTVIDSGDGVTHIVPVYEGYVIGSCIKHVPLAGRDVTNFIVQMLRDRGENFPPDLALDIAKKIKESHCYISPDLVKEYRKYDADPSMFRSLEGYDQKTNKNYKIDVGYERFLGPELFFSPEIFSSDWTETLPSMVDNTIQNCPVDTRRSLYKYITLSGGSTLFKSFKQRLQRDIRKIVGARQDIIHERETLAAKKANREVLKATEIDINVVSHNFQRYAVWFGGSMLAELPAFLPQFHTRQQYLEEGSRVVRYNAAFTNI